MDLQELREQIDKLDKQIVEILAKRSELVKRVGEIKTKRKLPVLDADREKLLLQKIAGIASKKKLSTVFIRQLFGLILKESKRLQRDGN